MIKFSQFVLIFGTFSTNSSVSSFVMLPPNRCCSPLVGSCLSGATFGSGKSDAESHLKEMPQVWEELKKKELDMIVQGKKDGTDDTEVTKKVVEKMIETALDYVQTKERVEVEHVVAAHKAYEAAIKEEDVLGEFVEADKVRDVPMDSYVEERYRAAVEAEVRAKNEETEAIHNFQQLKHSEEQMKATLDDLKGLDLEPWKAHEQ